MKSQQEVGQQDQGGKTGKESDDGRSLHPLQAQLPHIGVGRARRKSTQDADQGREREDAGGWLGHKGRADECEEDAQPLDPVGLLTQDKDGHEDGEKGRELVEHVGIRNPQMIHRPEIGQDPGGPEDAPHQQRKDVLPVEGDPLPRAQQDHHCHDSRHDIPEKSLLHGRHIAGQAHEDGHHGKEKGCHQDKQNALPAAAAFRFFCSCDHFSLFLTAPHFLILCHFLFPAHFLILCHFSLPAVPYSIIPNSPACICPRRHSYENLIIFLFSLLASALGRPRSRYFGKARAIAAAEHSPQTCICAEIHPVILYRLYMHENAYVIPLTFSCFYACFLLFQMLFFGKSHLTEPQGRTDAQTDEGE